MKIDVQLNIGEVVKRLELAERLAGRGAQKAVTEWADRIEKQTLQEVPRRSGTLADSFFRENEFKMTEYAVTVGYGGPNVRVNPKNGRRTDEYAVAVHEDLQADHPTGGKAKFLEDPVRQSTLDFAEESADIIRRTLGG